MAARQRGAKALLVVTGPRSPNAGQTVPMTFDTALAGSGIPAASISGKAAAALFGSRSLEAVQKELDTGNPHVAGFALDGVTVELSTNAGAREADGAQRGRVSAGDLARHRCREAVDRRRRALRPPRARAKRQLARERRRCGKPHVGADDNASGSAAVLAIAEAFAQPADAPAKPGGRALVGGRDRAGRLERVRECAAGSAESDRRVLQLRHGRPDAGQQARRAGDRHEPHVGIAHRARERRRRIRPDICSRIRISRPTSRRSTRPACRA